MVTLVKIVNSLVSLAAAIFAYIKFGKFYVAILAYLAAYALIKAINAVVLQYYFQYKDKHFPDPEVHFFQDRNFSDEPPKEDEKPDIAKGLRVMVVTEDLDGEEYIEYYKKMEAEAIASLDQPKTIFNLRYHFVEDRKLPYQAVWSCCGEGGKNVNKCIKVWYKTNALVLFTVKQPNREIFVYDGEMDIPEKGRIQFSVFFVFEQALPVTIKKDDPEETKEIAEPKEPQDERKEEE